MGRMRVPGVIRVEGWAGFPWLRAGFSTRQGGGSTVYCSGGEIAGSRAVTSEDGAMTAEQNLGWTAEDDAGVVAENRRAFLGAVVGAVEVELVTVRQIHSAVARVVERGGGALATPEGKAVLQGDGLLTREAGLILGVQTADCVPVLVADTRTRAVGAFHAGWRGTLERIVEQGVGRMQVEFGSRPDDLIAAVGPAIGPCCFAVGEEVRSEFEREFEYAGEIISGAGKSEIYLDLWEANRRQLREAGLRAEAVTVVGECSACARVEGGRRKYFSHRTERGVTGRMLSVVGMVEGVVDRPLRIVAAMVKQILRCAEDDKVKRGG